FNIASQQEKCKRPRISGATSVFLCYFPGVRCFVIGLISLAAAQAFAESDREYRSEEWQVAVDFPAGWSASAEPAYPGIVVRAVPTGGSRVQMTLAVQRVPEATTTTRSYIDQNRTTLQKIGFQGGRVSAHPSGALILDATAPDRTTSIRQAYFVLGDTAYVLTLAAPLTTVRSYGRAFDDTMRRMIDSIKRMH